MQFEWHPTKNKVNSKKHGVNFETAALVFEDPDIVTMLNHRYHDEERWQSLGLFREIVIYVIHTIGENEHDEEIIRIISARKATPRETREYYRFQKNARAT